MNKEDPNRDLHYLKLLIICAFLLTSFLSSQAQRTISGKVVEKGSNEPLPFATLTIKGTGIGVVTNLDGFFSLVNIESDEAILEVRYVGFNSLEIELGGVKDFLRIEMEPIKEQLEEVVVTANAYKVFDATSGISATTMSTKQLALLPSVGEPDIFRALQMLPGISSTNESSSGLFIRGGTPDQNLTLLDGMTVYKVDHFFGFLSAFNTKAIKDVRLFRGAFPARYGGRTSGVVELTGKTGSFEKVQGGANLSLLSFGGYLEVPLGDKLSLLVAGRRSYTEIIQGGLYNNLIDNLNNTGNLAGTPLEGANTITTEPNFYFFDWNSKLSYRPSDKDMITLSTYNGKDFLDESQQFNTNIGDQGVELDYLLDEQTDWGNRGLSTKWSRQWGPQWYSNLLVAGSEYFSNYDRDEQVTIAQPDSILFDRSRQTLEENSVIDLSIRADVEWQISLQSKAEFGFAYTHNQVDYDNIRDDTVTLLTRQQEANLTSFYVSSENGIGKRFKFIAGLRFSNYEFEDGLLFEPRLNLSYQMTPELKLKAAYGRHYQFANQIINQNISEGSREFWLLADGDLIDLGSAIHYVVGASYEINNWLFDVESYYKDLEGITEFSLQFRRGLNEEVEELFRTGDGFTRGIEFLIQKKQGMYTGWASYTLNDIQQTFPDLNDGFPFRPLHYQRHEFKMVHAVEVEEWNLSANFIYGSGNPFSEPANRYQIELLDGRTLEYIGLGARNASFNPPYIRVDLAAHYGFDVGKADASLGLSLFNLFNRQNVWYTEYDFGQSPPLINQINYLGFTPNLLFSIDF
ncbi:MAG: TonB-dependent receptor [Bacteroidota bacterium]